MKIHIRKMNEDDPEVISNSFKEQPGRSQLIFTPMEMLKSCMQTVVMSLMVKEFIMVNDILNMGIQ